QRHLRHAPRRLPAPLRYHRGRDVRPFHVFPERTAEPVVSIELSDQSLLKSGAFIGGQWVASDSGQTYDVTNPADERVIAQVAKCGAAETRRAIEAAAEAMRSWQKVSATGRAAILRKWHDLLMDNQEDLARLMTAEQGKPLAESRGEIAYAAGYLE